MVYIGFIQGKLDGTPQYIHDRDIECCRKRMTLWWLPVFSGFPPLAHSPTGLWENWQEESALCLFPLVEDENVAAAAGSKLGWFCCDLCECHSHGNKVYISRVCGVVATGFDMYFDKGFLYYRVLKDSLSKHTQWEGLGRLHTSVF